MQSVLTSTDHELSEAQQAVWAHERAFPGGIAYLVTSAFRLRPGVPQADLRDHLTVLVATHEALRTAIVETHAGPIRRVVAPFAPVLRRVEIDDLDGPACAAFLDLEFTTTIDIGTAPLARFTYVVDRLARALLVVVMHHLVADFPSLDVLVADLQALARTGSLPPAPASGALIGLQRMSLGKPEAAAKIEEWRDAVSPFMGLPRRHPRHRKDADAFAGFARSEILPVPPPLIRTAARALGATPFAIMLAAFALDEADLTGRDEIILGITVDAREGRESRRLMGYHVNTLPVIVQVPQDAPFAAIAADVHEQVNRLIRWRQIPFGRAIRGLAPVGGAMLQPVFEAMFHWLRFEPSFGGEDDPVFLGLQQSPGQHWRGTTHDVVLTIEDQHASLHTCWVLSGACFEADATACRSRRYGALVQQVVQEPRASVRDSLDGASRRLDLYERLEF